MATPAAKKLSIRERALAKGRTPASERVRVEAWDSDVEVRELPAALRARALSDSVTPQGKVSLDKLYAVLVINGTYDPESGERVFEDADRDELMGGTHGDALEAISSVAMRLNGLTASSVESAEKN